MNKREQAWLNGLTSEIKFLSNTLKLVMGKREQPVVIAELEYAAKILADTGCDRYTYGGEQSQYVLDDLKKAFPNGMKYPYVTVANAILEISRPRPIVREPWKMIWDNDNATDGVGYETFEAAKDAALDTLAAWAAQARAEWVREKPNTDEKYDWDCMICNCSVQVQKYNPDTDEYEDYWEPSHEDEQQVGWLEWKELRKMEQQNKK